MTAMLDAFDQVNPAESDWQCLGENLYHLRTNGITVPFTDALIATLAVQHGLFVWTMRLWQILGCVCCEDSNINSLTKEITNKFSDQLGEYKIISYHAPWFITDLFRNKFNWKNQLNVFFLLVDKKMPAELTKAMKDAESEFKEKESEKNE